MRFTLPRLAVKTSDPALFFEKGGVKLAAVGSHTADVLSQYGLSVALTPKRFDADGLVDALVERRGAQGLAGSSFLSFRASRGRKTLSERLTGYGARVREVVAYESVDVDAADPDVLDEMRRGKIDFATVASSASAKSFARLFGTALEKTRTVAISPLTANALEAQGARVAADVRWNRCASPWTERCWISGIRNLKYCPRLYSSYCRKAAPAFSAGLTETYRSGHNGADSKSVCQQWHVGSREDEPKAKSERSHRLRQF